MSATAYVALFGAGIASFLAPCVLPLVPAYVGMAAGDTATGDANVRATLLFVGGFSSIFVTLGMLAGRLGSSLEHFRFALQRGGGVVIILLGAALFASTRGRGLRERRLLRSVDASGRVARPLVLGVAFGAAWTPCVGPLLGAALVAAARTTDAWRGGTLLGAYALGIGTPFVAWTLTISSSHAVHTRVRTFARRIAPLSALALVILGVLLATGTYDRLVDPLARFAPGAA